MRVKPPSNHRETRRQFLFGKFSSLEIKYFGNPRVEREICSKIRELNLQYIEESFRSSLEF